MKATIEATGLNGWMAYRYQYTIEGCKNYFGYAATEEEALDIIVKAGK